MGRENRPNADLIAHSRTDIPSLCAEVRRLNEKLIEADAARSLAEAQDETLLSTDVKDNK